MHETNSKHRKSKLPTFLACLSHPCRRLQSQYLRQIPTTGFVRRFQGATFSRENIPLKTFTKMFYDLLLWQENHHAITVKKPAIIFFISTGIFASEPMTLREIDHVSFLVEHAQTFFAGEAPTAVKRLSMREDLLGDRYIRFGKSIRMWLRLLAGKNREIFFVFQESSLAMNRKNKKNV